MNPVELAQPILRGAHLISLLATFGTLLFLVLIMPAALGEAGTSGKPARRRIVRLAHWSAALALVTGFAWLVVQGAVIAGADSIVGMLQALPVVAMHTQFGRFVLVRCAVLIAVLPLVAARGLGLAVAIALTGVALGVQAGIGHAGAIGGSTGASLIGSELMHLVAAGAWLGGLLPLLIILSSLPQQAAVAAFRGFSTVGLPAVLILAGTALVQASVLVGGLPGLLGTAYGHVALLKLVLFLILLALAALNRFAFTAQLAGAASLTARRRMRLSVSLEMVIGALVVTVAAFLASLAPGVHQQPVWPLRWRPSLEALASPELRREVVTALAAVAAPLIILLVGLIWRRWR
jgi:putative copper export protein